MRYHLWHVAILLVACLALGGCVNTGPSALPLESPSAKPTQSPTSPTPTPTQAAQTPMPDDSPATSIKPSAQDAFPFDPQLAEPLLNAWGLAAILGQVEGFERFPSQGAVDAVFYQLFTSGALDDFKGVTQTQTQYTLGKKTIQALYMQCFSEGSFAGLPEDGGHGTQQKDFISYPAQAASDLQCEVQLQKEFVPLVEGYFEIQAQILWSYPEESQAVQGGTMCLWVKPDEGALFGIRVAKVELDISTRPGDDIGAHPQRDMEYILPVLHSLAKAANIAREGFQDGSPSNGFAWLAAHTMVNVYGEDFGLDLSGDSVYVSRQKLDEIFAALFGTSYQVPSSIPSKVSSRVSTSGGGYRFARMQEDSSIIYVDYKVVAGGVDIFSVTLKDDEQYILNAEVYLQYEEGLKYKGRLAAALVYKPIRAS